MAQQTQLAAFNQSWQKCNDYPQNLLYKTHYRGALKTYEERLETADPAFLTQDPKEVKIHFRDWDETRQGFVNSEITSEDMLRKHLSEELHPDPSNGDMIWKLVARKDPRCRFVFLFSGSTTKPLKITPRLLKRLLTYHQVMPEIVEFLTVFARRPENRELGFSGFFDQTTLSQKKTSCQSPGASQQVVANTRQHLVSRSGVPRGPAVVALGRSGKQYQLCYNLSRVIPREEDWSVQQNQFHHQFDLLEGTSLWINAIGSLKDYRREVTELTGGQNGKPEDLSFQSRESAYESSLTVHLMNCHWASNDWRAYIRFLEDNVEEKTRDILTSEWHSESSTPETLKDVQYFEEKAITAAMILEANIQCMTLLKVFYENILENNDFDLKDQCAEATFAFAQQMSNAIHTFTGLLGRAKFLVDITENKKNLLLQKLQSNATKKMEDLTTMSYREAIVMKVITAGTFVFLPATFVSTFFSTDVVKYQGSPGGKGSYSGVALARWLEVTIPLTALTLVLGFLAFFLADRRRKKRLPLLDGEKEP